VIKPSIGRVVLFQPGKASDQPLREQPFAAVIAYVWNDRMVNLAYFNENGEHRNATSVALLQDEDVSPALGHYAEWMPFQKGQAAKTEQAQKQLEVQRAQPTETAPSNPAHDFGFALFALKQGHRVARFGWNGKGMWLAYSPGSKALPAEKFWAGPNRDYAAANGGTADVLPCITMKTATGEVLMGWLASQSDMLAEDWTIVE
jgi:hypothetical protein